MAQSYKKKQFYVMAYGLGASVVIIGALFKILHFKIGFLTGGVMLTIGMVTEAIVFALSAFEEPEEEYDWTLVYPELKGGDASVKQVPAEVESMLSSKLDKILADAKIDSKLLGNLTVSIENFQKLSNDVNQIFESISTTKNYNDQVIMATNQMESLNNYYKNQLESSAKHSEINDEIAQNAIKMKEQMESLAANLSALNGVYGGMLTAMSNSNN